ncbi:MAG TPA: hypothetical protein VK982_12915 [Bacteroidales bacterium]|nr:hypothetical protein [Bacteroidales bacterium]
MKTNILYLLSLSFILFSCDKEEKYPDTPEIKFENFTLAKETENDFENIIGRLKFTFTDGDGDIGNDPNIQTTNDTTTTEVYNTFITRFYKENNQFVRDTTITYIIPYLEGGVYREYLKGEIEIKLYFTDFYYDTLKFDFYIYDRANHKSNTETTPEIIISEWI